MTTTVARGLTPVRTVLPSGAVVIAQQTSMTPAVTINATVRAGGLHEPANRTGLAYLLGRVLDRGTTTRDADVLSEALDDRGVSLRVASSRHATIVTCTCLSEDFDDVLSIALDIVRSASFPDSEVTKRKVESVSAIRRDDDNPAVRAVETLFEMLYGDQHPVRPPRQGLDREHREHHSRRSRSLPQGALCSGGVVAGHRRRRRAVARSRASGEGARWVVGEFTRGAGRCRRRHPGLSGASLSSTFRANRSRTSPTASRRSAASIRAMTPIS